MALETVYYLHRYWRLRRLYKLTINHIGLCFLKWWCHSSHVVAFGMYEARKTRCPSTSDDLISRLLPDRSIWDTDRDNIETSIQLSSFNVEQTARCTVYRLFALWLLSSCNQGMGCNLQLNPVKAPQSIPMTTITYSMAIYPEISWLALIHARSDFPYIWKIKQLHAHQWRIITRIYFPEIVLAIIQTLAQE